MLVTMALLRNGKLGGFRALDPHGHGLPFVRVLQSAVDGTNGVPNRSMVHGGQDVCAGEQGEERKRHRTTEHAQARATNGPADEPSHRLAPTQAHPSARAKSPFRLQAFVVGLTRFRLTSSSGSVSTMSSVARLR